MCGDTPLRLLKTKSKPARSRAHKVSPPLVELRNYKSPVYADRPSRNQSAHTPTPTQNIRAVRLEDLSKTNRAYLEAVERDVTIQPDHLSKSAPVNDVKLPPKPKPPVADDTASRLQPVEDGRFCICERPYLPGELMFKCEGYCGNWYHPKCLGMQDAEIEKHCKKEERWYCTECIQRAYGLVVGCNLLKSKK